MVLASVKDPAACGDLTGRRDRIEEVYDAAAAPSRSCTGRRHTAAMLGTLGVDIVDADAERLPPALADHYP